MKLSPDQRNLFLDTRDISAGLAAALKRAPVREGKLSVRVTAADLDALIAVAARVTSPDKLIQRRLDTLLKYLEGLEDRFEIPEDDAEE